MAQHYRTSIESTIISLPKVQLELTGVLSHITVITIQRVCERMSETAQQWAQSAQLPQDVSCRSG